MRHASRKLALLGLGALAVLTIVSLPTWGQEAVEPSGELASADCYGHHKAEGFRSMDLFPQAIAEVPKGQPFTLELTIKNPWLHDLKDVQAYVNISGAPGLAFPGAKEPVSESKDLTIQAAPAAPAPGTTPSTLQTGTASFDIPVEDNATEILVQLAAPSAGAADPVGAKSDFELTVVSPDGATKVVDGSQKAPGTGANGRHTQNVKVDRTNVTRAGPGTWKATVKYAGFAPSATAKVTSTVYYNLSQSQELVLNGPALLKPGERHTFTFTVNAKDVEALQALRYGGRGLAYHQHTDKSIGDDGTYDKWNTLPFATGTTLKIGSINLDQGGSVSLFEPVLRRWGQVLGLAGSFLIIPSLVFGGTFGKSTIEPLNRWFGGARRRVLFHNSMSFWLLGIGVLHMFIFFYEAFWNWSHGLVWGGLTLASMVGLGVTGATQRSFVARWGFTRWRFVHFAMGILVVVFVLIHMTADGSHFAPIRDALFGKDPSRA